MYFGEAVVGVTKSAVGRAREVLSIRGVFQSTNRVSRVVIKVLPPR